MKARRITAAVVAGAVLAATLVSSPPAVAAAGPAPTPVVQGNRLTDSRTGATFVPHGVNIPGLEYSCVQGWRHLPDVGEFAAIASWKINTVRLPLNESCWLGLDGAPTGSTVAQYKADVSTWVDGAVAAGLVVILDLHWNAPAGYTASGQRAMPDERSAAFWSSVATTFAANKSVMFELFNEPYSRSGFTLSWGCWKNGGCLAPVENDATGSLSGAKYTVTGMQQLVTAVRTAGATQPLLLGGLNYSNDLSGWLANKPTDPLNQLVAAWHNYPGQGCSTSCWNSTVTTVAASVPIVTTEFGNTAETGSTVAGNSGNYLVPFMTWADAHGIGYLPWAWWDVGAAEANGSGSDIYALYTGSSFTAKFPSGTKFKDYLASYVPPSTERHDYSGDGIADLLVVYADGSLQLRRGTGTSSWLAPKAQSISLTGMTKFFGAGDFDGDGRNDVLAVDSAGTFWLFRGNGTGGWIGAKTRLGSSWNKYSAIIAPGDFSGDGFVDLLAVDSTGQLWLHQGNGIGGWLGPKQVVGTGWQTKTAIVGPGDFDGDGFVDVIAREPNGELWLHPGNGSGGWLASTRIGTGWNALNVIVSAGDVNSDGVSDLLGRNSAGALWLYRGTGTGGFLTPVQAGSGWLGRTLVP